MPRRRGRPSRADDVAGYLDWRAAEERAAEEHGHGPARADDVVNASQVEGSTWIADASTVWDWRRTRPSVDAWRAWLLERWPELRDAIVAGELDGSRSSAAGQPVSEAIAAFRATMIPRLDVDLAQLRGARPTAAELARLTGSSVRTVKRHRAEYLPIDGPPVGRSGSAREPNVRSERPSAGNVAEDAD